METGTKKENEEKKAYLRRYRAAQIAEKQIAEEMDALRLNTMLPSSRKGDGMPHGSGAGDLSGYMVALDALEKNLQEQMEKRIRIRKEITAAIELMDCESEKALLRYRYIMGYRWEDIGEKMSLSWMSLHRLHGRALKNFQIPKDGIE